MAIDDVGDLSRRRQYTATADQVRFTYPFRIFSENDLVVYVGTTLKAVNTDYTVEGVDDDTGGDVVFLAGLDAGDEVTIYSDTIIERETDFQQNGQWTSEATNREFDRSYVIDQEQRQGIRRTLRGSVLEGEVDPLPDVATRASKFLRFDSSGNPQASNGDPTDPLSVDRQHVYATSGQTVFHTEWAYTPGLNQLTVIKNRAVQVLGVDYEETDSDTFTFLTPLVAGDIVEYRIGDVYNVTLLEPTTRREDFVMTEGADEIVLTQNTYSPGNNQIALFRHGALLRPGADYSETNSTTITLLEPAQESDEFTVLINQGFGGLPTSTSSGGTFPLSAAEEAAGVTPSDYTFPWGNVFRYGCLNDGSTADTPSFSQALSCHPGSFCIPYTGVDYYCGRLVFPSFVKAVIEPGVVIHDIGGLSPSESTWNFSGTWADVEALGATITQDGQYGSSPSRHGVLVTGTGIKIRGLTASSCGGDGIHVRSNATGTVLDNCRGNSNYGDGVKVVSATNLTVTAPVCQTNTGRGLAIEPEGTSDFLANVLVTQPRATGNTGAGVEVNLDDWNTSAREVDVHIQNPYCRDNGGDDASADYTIRRARTASTVRGIVRLTAPLSLDAGVAGIAVRDWDITGPRVIIDKPLVVNPNQSGGSDATLSGGILLHASSVAAITTAPGNVKVLDAEVLDYDGNLAAHSLTPFMAVMTGSGVWTGAEFRNPKSNSASALFLVEAQSGVAITYDKAPEIALTSTTSTASPGQMGAVIHNDGLGATHTVSLPSVTADNLGCELTYSVRESQYIELDPFSTQQILPGSGGAGYKWRSNTVGSTVTIRAVEAGYWHIIRQTGTWASVA